jgi:anthranilate phosphoribosyltransferase
MGTTALISGVPCAQEAPISLPPNGFLARDAQFTELDALLRRGRLVTLTGPPGAGKSRLLAEYLIRNGLDPSGFVDLTEAAAGADVSAALVAAAAGAPVAKHGNRSVSSRSGSADVLAALGMRLDEDPATAGRALEGVGICFLFAPYFHPGMREVMPVRRELALRTVFNLLGPLTNPAGARRQLMGVYAASLVEPIGHVLAELGSEHAMVVHGDDGLDEITTTGVTRVCEVRGGAITTYTIEPEALGLRRADLAELAGGGPEENAALMREVLAGVAGPLADVTVLNAGAALYVAGLAADLPSGVARARAALASGEAAEKLAQLVRFLA